LKKSYSWGSSNLTIATFSNFAFYKQEGYAGNLYAGKIFEEHGVPVAYKSVSLIVLDTRFLDEDNPIPFTMTGGI
jgi:hypothetical protein